MNFLHTEKRQEETGGWNFWLENYNFFCDTFSRSRIQEFYSSEPDDGIQK